MNTFFTIIFFLWHSFETKCLVYNLKNCSKYILSKHTIFFLCISTTKTLFLENGFRLVTNIDDEQNKKIIIQTI